MKIMTIDPGESIGIVDTLANVSYGRTITGPDRLVELWKWLDLRKPNVIVYEEFALRQSSAVKLIGSKFLTCEVIGIIKLYAQINSIRLIPLLPMNKEYCGFGSNPKNAEYAKITVLDEKITEHIRDAYRLYRYAELFKLKEKET